MAGRYGDRDRLGLFPGEPSGFGSRSRLVGVVVARVRRWLVPALLMAAAVGIISMTQSGLDADVENMWAAGAFLVFVGGATGWVWRRAADEGLESLRWRRLHRRVFWRVATICLFASLAALWTVAFWEWRADDSPGGYDPALWAADQGHAAFFRGLSGWLALAAIPVVFVEPFAWLLWPRSLRAAVRNDRATIMIARDRGPYRRRYR
jgi:hypothetical protein